MVTDGYMCMGNMCMGMHVHVHAHVACAHGHAAWTDMTTHALCIACGYRTASYVAWLQDRFLCGCRLATRHWTGRGARSTRRSSGCWRAPRASTCRSAADVYAHAHAHACTLHYMCTACMHPGCALTGCLCTQHVHAHVHVHAHAPRLHSLVASVLRSGKSARG